MDAREQIDLELLVLRCQEGDAAAFELLAGQWHQRLWRHAWRLTGDENTAWDVLQESWIGIARGIGRLEEPAAFAGWAYQIVSHKCRDWIRHEQHERAVAGTRAVRADAEATDADASESAITREEYASLQEAMKRLPGPDRAILCLRYEEGFGTGEVAAILDVPEGTVKSRLYYAKQRLRLSMENNHGD